MKPQRERLVTELTTALVTVPRVAIARWRAAMGLMGLGLGTSGVGLAWDFYVHEIARDIGEVESIFATPHLDDLGHRGAGDLHQLCSAEHPGRFPRGW